MTEQEIADLGPAFAHYLGRYRQKRTAAHFDPYCRGLLSDLPRKSVEPGVGGVGVRGYANGAFAGGKIRR